MVHTTTITTTTGAAIIIPISNLLNPVSNSEFCKTSPASNKNIYHTEGIHTH